MCILSDVARCGKCKQDKPLHCFEGKKNCSDCRRYLRERKAKSRARSGYVEPQQCEETKIAWRVKNRSSLAQKQRSWYRLNRKQQAESSRRCSLRRKYGISPEHYDKLLKSQGGRCAICVSLPKRRKLDVDHCHKTGVVRGLLCWRCNTAIGKFQDDPNILEQAASYLKRARQLLPQNTQETHETH